MRKVQIDLVLRSASEENENASASHLSQAPLSWKRFSLPGLQGSDPLSIVKEKILSTFKKLYPSEGEIELLGWLKDENLADLADDLRLDEALQEGERGFYCFCKVLTKSTVVVPEKKRGMEEMIAQEVEKLLQKRLLSPLRTQKESVEEIAREREMIERCSQIPKKLKSVQSKKTNNPKEHQHQNAIECDEKREDHAKGVPNERRELNEKPQSETDKVENTMNPSNEDNRLIIAQNTSLKHSNDQSNQNQSLQIDPIPETKKKSHHKSPKKPAPHPLSSHTDAPQSLEQIPNASLHSLASESPIKTPIPQKQATQSDIHPLIATMSTQQQQSTESDANILKKTPKKKPSNTISAIQDSQSQMLSNPVVPSNTHLTPNPAPSSNDVQIPTNTNPFSNTQPQTTKLPQIKAPRPKPPKKASTNNGNAMAAVMEISTQIPDSLPPTPTTAGVPNSHPPQKTSSLNANGSATFTGQIAIPPTPSKYQPSPATAASLLPAPKNPSNSGALGGGGAASIPKIPFPSIKQMALAKKAVIRSGVTTVHGQKETPVLSSISVPNAKASGDYSADLFE